ncbi:hypothetical protein EAS56_06575 [Bradyrhizobium guangzhouense]|uniref:Uncharacterized protein n=1 Tax=Bradyrhizobium guangzhouense TaxID=1325095 RepID=A0ABY0EEN5_9BRAD|nr:hypothetical protein EAS56_06575 [Bradyrhizobium guangzhouense]
MRAAKFARHSRCHAPRRRSIQYAAAPRFNRSCLGVLDRPVKPGDDTFGAVEPGGREAMSGATFARHSRYHAPRKRSIQYAAATRFNHSCLGVLDRPVEPGDDTFGAVEPCDREAVSGAKFARHSRCHAPRKRGIQYSAAPRFNRSCLGVLDRPVKAGR